MPSGSNVVGVADGDAGASVDAPDGADEGEAIADGDAAGAPLQAAIEMTTSTVAGTIDLAFILT
jgi:hypothetical protein